MGDEPILADDGKKSTEQERKRSGGCYMKWNAFAAGAGSEGGVCSGTRLPCTARA